MNNNNKYIQNVSLYNHDTTKNLQQTFLKENKMNLINKSKKQVLFAIPSFQDPGLPDKKDRCGPLLQLMQEKHFDRVVLLGLPVWRLHMFLCAQRIQSSWKNILIDKKLLEVGNIHVYQNVFNALKRVLDEYKEVLNDTRTTCSFLLPPSTCECLLDSWLLLASSLSRDAKIFQIESHFSIESSTEKYVWAEALENKNNIEVNDTTKDIFEPFIPKVIPNHLRLLINIIRRKDKVLFFPNTDAIKAGSVAHALFNFTEKTKASRCMTIKCDQLPREIAQEILFGYNIEIENGIRVQKKGLLQYLKSGLLLLANVDKFNHQLQEKLVKHVESCPYRCIFTSDQKKVDFQPTLVPFLSNVYLP